MKDLTSLHARFQEVISKGPLDSLDRDERLKMANLFLQTAEETFAEESIISEEAENQLLKLIQLAEELVPESAEIQSSQALFLFRLGVLLRKSQYLFFALDKLSSARTIDPELFEQATDLWHLWGNVLLAVGRLTHDESFIQTSLKKYQKASETLVSTSSKKNELYWDWAEAWILSGKLSGEISDIFQGLEKFAVAARYGVHLPHFWIDYGEAQVFLGERLRRKEPLETALGYFRRSLFKIDDRKKNPLALAKAWRAIALTSKKIFELTGGTKEFQSADETFREAILAVPTQADLWLHWGELFLRKGWVSRNGHDLETALEKFTSSKISECDPLLTSLSIGQTLIALGILLDEFKFIKEGEKRILTAVDDSPENAELNFAKGLSFLGWGYYFNEDTYFVKAIEKFKKAVRASESPSIFCLHGLFQAYVGWGEIKGEPFLIRKGIDCIENALKLAPHFPYFWNEWGVALIKLRRLEKERLEGQTLCEEAIEKFEYAIQLRPNDPEKEWLYNLGCCSILLGEYRGEESDYAKAVEVLSKVFYSQPEYLYVRYHLALAFARHGELTANIESLYFALDLFQALLKRDEEDDLAWGDLGYVLLNLSQLLEDPAFPGKGLQLRQDAKEKLMRAAELGNVEVYYHLACLYSLEGNTQRSLEFLYRSEIADVLPSNEELEYDDWLEEVRKTKGFQEFLERRKTQQEE